MSGPTQIDWTRIIRPNILKLQPYRCARDDYSSGILLDANENALGHSLATEEIDLGLDLEELALNRYPDPAHLPIKERIAKLRNFKAGAAGVFLGVGSDEAIDLLVRITCLPGKDSILICPPTYGMYSVCAVINDVNVVKVPLNVEDGKFQPQINEILEKLSSLEPPPKLVFITSPGNPTGTLIPSDKIRPILDHPTWRGIVVVDEAYIDFAEAGADGKGSAIHLLNEGYQNLVVMQTLSKGFGLAGIRLGMTMSDPALAQIMANTKAPYNICTPTAVLATRALSDASISLFHKKIGQLLTNRTWLYNALQSEELQSLGIGAILGRQDANFLLVQVVNKETRKPDNTRSQAVYTALAETQGVVVRFRGNEVGCEGCLRITVGTEAECKAAIDKLKETLNEI